MADISDACQKREMVAAMQPFVLDQRTVWGPRRDMLEADSRLVGWRDSGEVSGMS